MSAVSSHPLLAHRTPESIVAWRHGEAISVAGFLGDVARIAAVLPAGRHVLNTCSDRYCFAVGFAATLVSGRVSLLPSTFTQEVAGHLRVFAPDVFCLTDGNSDAFGLPCVVYPDGPPADASPSEIPLIAGDRPVAWLFTSGSTGKPVPHQKTWGALVVNVRAEGEVLGLFDGRRHSIVGTVPAQHMYGFESTVMVALQSGAAFSSGRPLFPADICSAIAAVPRPRVLVTTPFHLRTLLDAGVDIPDLDLLLSATAPLSPNLVREAEARCRAPLLEIYGSTETGQIASRRPVETAEWQLFPGVHLTVEDGRVWASGGHVEGNVGMSDMLEITGPGRFLLHGRSADMINIAGKRSSLAYLNHQLCAVPGVIDGTFVIPDEEPPDGVTRLIAVVAAPGMNAATLTLALRARIEPAFLPRRVLFVAGLPRNATGKLPAEALRALIAEHSKRQP
jgi:acyl-coenzyme A synthetase/AMP-(fatty) acid ligase